jgi:hypothetical protein
MLPGDHAGMHSPASSKRITVAPHTSGRLQLSILLTFT